MFALLKAEVGLGLLHVLRVLHGEELLRFGNVLR